MNSYKPIFRVLGILFIVAGIGAIFGGNFSHSYVSAQLEQEKITMPAVEALQTETQLAALEQYAGQPMTTGPQAEAFANHYILEHMNKMADGKTYQEVSGEFTKMRKDENANPEELKKLENTRMSLFMGDTLRGMLLTAYAWWTVGTVALYAGIALLIAGIAGVAASFLGAKKAA